MLLPVKIISLICLSSFISTQAQQVFEESRSFIDTSYLESKNQLEDYILDTGDILKIEFNNTPELSGFFPIDEKGEIFFERIKYTYVRGLTIRELTRLLEKRYEEFLINPEIYIKISTYKPIRVSIRGEVKAPGVIRFPALLSINRKVSLERKTLNSNLLSNQGQGSQNLNSPSLSQSTNKTNYNSNSSSSIIKRSNDYVTTLSNAIKGAGGLTSYSDLKNLEIVRDIPIEKGGGKKRAVLDFRSFINDADPKNDIRIFDGDSIFIPRLQEKNPTVIPNSVISGLSPRFIKVTISGQINNPGTVKIPIEGSLSDVMNLTGPRKPLSGKIYLIRYKKDGSLLRENINYSANARPGSLRNPYLIANDLITVKNSILGRTSGTLRALTDPLAGIYSTNELYKGLTQ
ncbi:polysaccharide biosynthesis/export family protein [Prochlorococcus marinus]|uniref:polysaccharide biosynthesis/export family protein n=1 Tax=Prochlorococcus marinus TaxID=1219 RepID=UPI0039B043A4